jgi:hypothetical protein
MSGTTCRFDLGGTGSSQQVREATEEKMQSIVKNLLRSFSLL